MADSTEKKKETLSKADIQRIASLPRSKHIVAGIIQDTIVDPVTGYIYFPNPNSKTEYDKLLPTRVKPTDPSILSVDSDKKDKSEDAHEASASKVPEQDQGNGTERNPDRERPADASQSAFHCRTCAAPSLKPHRV